MYHQNHTNGNGTNDRDTMDIIRDSKRYAAHRCHFISEEHRTVQLVADSHEPCSTMSNLQIMSNFMANEVNMIFLLTGIYITSDEFITIHTATHATSSSEYHSLTPDAVLARPVSNSALEYFLAGYDETYTGSAYPK